MSKKENEKEKEYVEWEAPRRKKDVSAVFYVALLAVLSLLLIFSIWQKNILFGIFSILAVGTILYISSQEPEIDKFRIDDDQILINEKNSYGLDTFSHFDIFDYGNKDLVLIFVQKSKLKPTLQLNLDPEKVEEIMNFVSKILPRKKVEPSLIDILQRMAGM